ncbi:unnamed protein product [Brassicogethes aeneus]|uniref:Protein hunchback n=1 Tax=Brassicogethes aeneus TaxID=1431903 RepID=A0A9P0AW78_BRAAE|nr:unnamed protein product [Brassicogethes aeneus]
MVYCAITGCTSNNNKKSKNYSNSWRYFTFPTDKEICKLWVEKCHQKHNFNIKNARICSKHFSDDDFCDKEKLLKLPKNKWKLKNDAIPSFNLAKMVKAQTSVQKDSDNRTKKRNLVKNIQNIVNTCTMEQTIVKIEPEELVVDSKGDIFMNYNKTSTCTAQKMPSTSGITIKQEIKEELDDDKVLGSEIKDSDEDNSDHGNKMDRFFCNIKEERRDGDFSEEDDKNLSGNEEKDEDEAMFETKIEVEYHGVQYDDQSGKKKLFKCDLCPKKYDSKKGVSQHKKFFHFKDEQEQFKCDQCDYVTVRKGIFKRHLKVHEKNNNLKCQFCEFKALELWSLNAHILSKHKLEKEERVKIKQLSKIYECSKCSYLTIKKSQYDSHIKFCLKLENVKWHKCDICHYQSIRKRLLEIHMKIHNKIKEFKCLFCTFHSNEKKSLDNHLLRKHQNLLEKSNKNIITSKMYCCKHCKYKTTLSINFKCHLKSNH